MVEGWTEGNSVFSLPVVRPRLVFREEEGEVLEQGGEEDEELRLCQLLPQTHTVTCGVRTTVVSDPAEGLAGPH